MTYFSTAVSAKRIGLSPDDLEAITRTTSNIDDIPPASLASFQAGFDYAYHVARLVTEGLKDPLSR